MENTQSKGLEGTTIVFTGILSVCSRDKLENYLKTSEGVKITGSISGKTTYLIVGEKLEDGRKGTEGNKYKEATKKGTKIIHENELDDWLYDKIGKHLDDIFEDSSVGKLYKKST